MPRFRFKLLNPRFFEVEAEDKEGAREKLMEYDDLTQYEVGTPTSHQMLQSQDHPFRFIDEV